MEFQGTYAHATVGPPSGAILVHPLELDVSDLVLVLSVLVITYGRG